MANVNCSHFIMF